MLVKMIELLVEEHGVAAVMNAVTDVVCTKVPVTAQDVMAEMQRCDVINTHNKIERIKAYRNLSGRGLKESKGWVEANMPPF